MVMENHEALSLNDLFQKAHVKYAAKTPRDSLFTHTIKRAALPDSEEDTLKYDFDIDDEEDTLDCKYKFDVNDDEEAFYIRDAKLPTKILKDGEGILLVVTVQWDVVSYIGRKRGTYPLNSRHRSFYLPISSHLDDDVLRSNEVDDAEEQLRGVVSPLVYCLGLRSVEEHHSITQKLVSFASSLYLENKQHCRDTSSSRLIPLHIEIVLEIISPLTSLGPTLKHPWSAKDSARFFLEFECLRKLTNWPPRRGSWGTIFGAEEPACCSICSPGSNLQGSLVSRSRSSTACGHISHEACIAEWLDKILNCPKCRPITFMECQWSISPKRPRLL